MIGIFQIVSVSFLFWMIMSLFRFVFDTLDTFRRSSYANTRSNFFVAAGGGVGIVVALGTLLFFELGLTEPLFTEGIVSESSLLSLITWLVCTSIGSYLVARLYMYGPYRIGGVVGVGSAVVGAAFIIVFFSDGLHSSNEILWLVGSTITTVVAGLLGSHVAGALNIFEKRWKETYSEKEKLARIQPNEVAVVIAAHNEEITIGSTIQSLLRFTAREHIYVGSDGSSDKTVDVVRSFGCHADDIQPNRGKAGALVYVLQHNTILSRYKAVFFLDADITIDPTFYTYTLPHFDDPRIAAVSGYFEVIWPSHFMPRWDLLVSAYRIRLWRVLQFLVRYGQTWRYTNASPIIPGGGSIYRTSVLERIDIDAPCLVIEDFNMTFEVHHKKLGLIVFEPRARAYNQEPYSISDFIRQIKRWYLGYFQTMRRHGLWPSFFCFSTCFFTVELFISSFLFLLAPFFALEFALGNEEFLYIDFYVWGYSVTLLSLLIAALAIDYCVTIVVALIEKKPSFLLYGIGFFPLRYIESIVFISMLPLAFLRRSDGMWKSPMRKAYETSA